MSAAPDAFTWATLGTIGGATVACTVVPNVVGAILPIPDRVRAGIALVLALVIEIVVLYGTAGTHNLQGLIVAVLNGFLVAAAALGINQAGSGGGATLTRGPTDVAPSNSTTRAYRTSWLS